MTRRIPVMVLFVGSALFVAGGLRSAEPEPDRVPQPRRGAAAPNGAEKSKPDAVRPGDLLVLTIGGLAPFSEYIKPIRVGTDGTANLPTSVAPMKLAGLSLAEVEQATAKALRESRALEHADVWVDRMERGDAPSVEPGPIAPGDVVRVSVTDLLGPNVEQVRNLHVSEAGNVGLPIVGQTKVAGFTEAEAEAAVLRTYREKGIIEHTLVSVLRVKLPPGPEPIPTGASFRPAADGGQ